MAWIPIPPSPSDLSSDAAADPADPDLAAALSGPLKFDEGSLLELAREHSVGLFSEDCHAPGTLMTLPPCSPSM